MITTDDPELAARIRADAIAALKCIHGRRYEMDGSEYLLIKGARDDGIAWREIADALGLASPQGAMRRYRVLAGRHAHDWD